MKKKSDKIHGSFFQKLVEDHCDTLQQAFRSFLVWESFTDLVHNTRQGSASYPRVFFFQPLTLSFVDAAFDSFVVNLYKFHDNRSHELETLVDVGVTQGAIESWLEPRLRQMIGTAVSFAAKKEIDALRNRKVGHYDLTADYRSTLTTVHPTPKELREYFSILGEILKECAMRARFGVSPHHYDQGEDHIKDTASILIKFIRGEPTGL